MKIIKRSELDSLFNLLHRDGYETIGPCVKDNAIIYDVIKGSAELPLGWSDEQDKGMYRLKKNENPTLFAYAVGPHSWKKFFHPSEQLLWKAKQTENGFEVLPEEKEEKKKLAFIGVRACELSAMSIQQNVFAEGAALAGKGSYLYDHPFIVAINCTHPSKNCFCTSMETGPKAQKGFDISFTEIYNSNTHYFIAETGSERGVALLEQMPGRAPVANEIAEGEIAIENSAKQINKKLNTHGIKELLYNNYDHPQWEKVADRCLSCGNCTMVCPTCFCSTVEDTIDISGQHAERWNKWDSCFSIDFSYIHGGPVRNSVKSRYRQWMTHKLATWIDQFGTSGCVGCGRCITWCPVGIDITEETASIRNNQKNNEI
jgi:ferredoxin